MGFPARQFAARLAKVEDTKLRAELRDRFEELCQQHAGYEGKETYNVTAEQWAFDHMNRDLTARGY